MKNRSLLFIMFVLIFNNNFVWSNPNPEEMITLTADEGRASVKIPCDVLKQHSEFMVKMFEFMGLQSEDKVATTISLDETLQETAENLKGFGINFDFKRQGFLDKLAKIFDCINKQEDLENLILDQDASQTSNLLFVGDVLNISELVSTAASVLARNILEIDSKLLFGLIQCDCCFFADILTKKIIDNNFDLFFPTNVSSDFSVSLEGHIGGVNSAKFSRDGKQIVTASNDATVKIWKQDSAGSWCCVSTISDSNCSMLNADISSDGMKIVAMCSDKTIRVYELDCDDCWKCTGKFSSAGCDDMCARFSREGKYILLFLDDILNFAFEQDRSGIWSRMTSTHSDYDTFLPENFQVDCNRCLMRFRDGKVIVWEEDSDDGMLKPNGAIYDNSRDYEIMSSAFSGDGRKIATGYCCKTKIDIWEQDVNKKWSITSVLDGHRDMVSSVWFSHDDKQILSGSLDGTARIWTESDCGNWRCAAVFCGQMGGLGDDRGFSASFSPDGRQIITVSNETRARIWDVSFLTKLTLRQVLFFVFAKYYQNCFENFNEGWRQFFSEIWQSFVPQVQHHLAKNFPKINFVQFK